VKELRDKTGCGMMDCKKALKENNGNMEKAVEFLRKKGLASVAKRAGRTAAQGVIDSYVHTGGKIGVLVEINCETDFVAKNIEFQSFVKDLAMQIAAQSPQYIKKEDVPDGIIQHEKNILTQQTKDEGKPEKAIEKIVEGRLNKFYQEVCLLEQPFIKEPKKNINHLLGEIAAKIGENIVIRRFIRYQLGEKS
ncbi:MAG: translation elongation factor Ts, partial [Candidatus Saganbacteria bacterium]|nr:translation elongation factor Ts [Candidatus Saganbacteria bacterium]